MTTPLQRPFGKTELNVSPIGFGCSRIGGLSAAGGRRTEAIALLRQAMDRGINFFDTADAYARGDSERLLGEAVMGARDRVIIATKGGYLFDDQIITSNRLEPARSVLRRLRDKTKTKLTGRGAEFSEQDFSARYIQHAVEQSLRRLRTDYIDLYQLHAPRGGEAKRSDLIEALDRLRQSGKIRYFGVGLEAVDDLGEWLSYDGLASVQLPYGLLDPEARTAVLANIAAAGRAVMARGIYGGGLLKGGADKAWLRRVTPKWEQVAALHELAAESGRPIYDLALHYVLHDERVSLALLGMHTFGQLDSNLNCLSRGPLAEHTLRALDALIH